MKKLALGLGTLLIVTRLSVAGPKDKGFTGEIMDSQCAPMGSHSPAGYQMTKTDNPKDCTLACAKMGGKFVLYDGAKKVTYQLDDQDKAKEFAGQKVKITGTYDEASKTIHITTIEAAS
jgi:hypothetical protein